MRGAMPNHKSLVPTLWHTSSLALLAFALVAPTRPSEFVIVSSQPECLRRNFAPPPGQPTTYLSAAMATDDVLRVDALPSDDEEPDPVVALDVAQVSFLLPCSFRKVSDRQLIAPPSILSFYPLRC
jgi:hypothetical protein